MTCWIQRAFKEFGTGETQLTHQHPVEGQWPTLVLPLNGVQPIDSLDWIIRPW